MESVFTAIVVIFLILFAVLTLSDTAVTSQVEVADAYSTMEARLDEQSRTSLAPVNARVDDLGQVIEMIYRNDGETKLADFDQWDLVVQYYDQTTPATYTINWIAYTDGLALMDNQWRVMGIYEDAATGKPELFDRSILNPGEELKLNVRVSPVVGEGQAVNIILATPSGISTSHSFRRNLPPVVTVSQTLVVPEWGSGIITPTILETTDSDNANDELVYTVSTTPLFGRLNRGIHFTQADIAAGLLSYTHLGPDVNDQFSFIVSDGETTTLEQSFNIVVNRAPVVQWNTGLILIGGGTGLIESLRLMTSDADNLPSEVQYRVTIPPQHGTLSLGSTFTQQQISDNQLSYTYYGGGSDSFTFIVTDGLNTTGSFTFLITVS
jgi:hypothetical protein